LVGANNKRYQWEQYRTSDEALKRIRKKAVRKYYETMNQQIDRFIWVDKLLDSALVPRLLNAYADCNTIPEDGDDDVGCGLGASNGGAANPKTPLRRRPSYVRKMADEETPLLDEDTWGKESSDQTGGIVYVLNLTRFNGSKNTLTWRYFNYIGK